MRICVILLKIPAILLLAAVTFFVVVIKLAEKVSSFALSVLLLVLIGCAAYSLYQTRWQDALLVFAAAVEVILALFAVEALTAAAEGVQERIGRFIHS